MKCTYFIRISNMKANCLTFFCLLCMFVIINIVGKTTLRKGLVRCLAHGSRFSKIFLAPIIDFSSKLKDMLRQTQRTHGIEIRELKLTEGVNLSIWDMAGQQEFHAFHDFMLPNLDGTSYPSLFLLVCSPFKHVEGNPKRKLTTSNKNWTIGFDSLPPKIGNQTFLSQKQLWFSHIQTRLMLMLMCQELSQT
jgi:hypothetical protein